MTELRDSDKRDDFSPTTKELLAKRAGYICSYPGCRRMTVAGSDDRKSGLTLTGVAAHITAAGIGGPRYDADMSPEERRGESNGFWACQIHGKFIDDNPSCCTVDELIRWKAQHERWVFDRVESGAELFSEGVYRFTLSNIGIFTGEHNVPLGRHNIVVGKNESGKSTFCQTLIALSGGRHWVEFDRRFEFSGNAEKRPWIAAAHQSKNVKTSVKLSPQFVKPTSRGKIKLQRIHAELNGNPSVSWPASLFKALYFESQFSDGRGRGATFPAALSYLASVFSLTDDLLWDCLREEIFATSTFGYRFKRTARRQVDILVPDGRVFYLPYRSLSTSEIQMAYLDIAMKLAMAAPQTENWMLVLDTAFFGRFDELRRKRIFEKLTSLPEPNFQTVFCLNSIDDADVLRSLQSEKWVNAAHFDAVTLHAFL